jgi:hypothetical protein
VCLDSFVEYLEAIEEWVSVWVFYSDPLVFLSVFLPIAYYFYYYGLQYSLKSVMLMPTALDIAQNCFGYLSFVFP